MISSIKRVLLQAAASTGVAARLRDSEWRRGRLLILCYHGIAIEDEHFWNPMLYMSQQRFRQRLTAIRDGGYQVLPLDEAVRRLYEGTLPPRSVAITFDDGAYDFVERALPVLAEFGFPATVYLTTYYSGLQLPVFDTAWSYVLWKSGKSEVDCAGLLPGTARCSIDTSAARTAFMLRVKAHATMSELSGRQKGELLQLLAERLEVNYDRLIRRRILHIMSKNDVASLPQELIDVQLHTHHHRTPRVREAFLREIRENRSEIRSIFNEPLRNPSHFCYPSGVHDAVFLPWLREAEVTSATTCVPGLAKPTTDPLLLPRLVDTMQVPSTTFEAWLSGTATWLPRRRPEPTIAA